MLLQIQTTEYIFWFLSFFAVMCACMVVFTNKPVHSVLYLVLTFFAIAGHYVLLNAQFLAVVHIVVYAGAIMVLFLFVIMMLNLNHDTEPVKNNLLRAMAVLAFGTLLVTLVGALKGASIPMRTDGHTEIGMIKRLGDTLFKDYLLPFELSSVLLLAAMVGTVLLGKKEIKS
ncbi:MAG: NADH-quinone oxidoreductase subunit J [Bacteroidia bacterium]|nr:NADH-quinone oxidoreductase subunit J [Bacteroidia bacterium]